VGVEKPARSLFVMNGTTVTTALPDLGHRESIDLAASPEAARFVQGLMVWLGGDLAAVQRDYTVVWKPAAAGTGPVVVLTPGDPALVRLLTSITLTLGGAPLQIEKVVLVEPGGDHVDIAFSSIERDPALPAGTFSLP
jgi:outer membrane lipoprotein-sorting protein